MGDMAYQKTGTAIGDVVELEDVGGSAGLPAVDGSQLTGITATASISVVLIDDTDSPYTIAAGVTHVIADCTAGNITVNMPTAGTKRQVTVARASDDTSQTYNVTLDGNGADTVSGDATQTVYRSESFMMVSDGVSDWVVI